MDKISGILPQSPRMKLMEVASAQPARPGAPDMGRPMGKNSIGERITMSKQLDELRDSGQLPTPAAAPVYKNTEANKIKVIEDINKKFFSSPGQLASDKESARDSSDTMSEAVLRKTMGNDDFIESPKTPTRPRESLAPLEN
jgi:hypothetical protein